MRWRRTSSTLTVVLALAVGHEINARMDVDGRTAEPFVTSGSVGAPVHLTYGDVTVTQVRTAKYIAPPVSTELVKRAAGVWVLVAVEVKATREPTLFAAAYLVDDQGRQLRSTGRAFCAASAQSPTQVPVYALYCFDVAKDSLAGLHFQIGRGNLIYSTLQSDAVADVDLGISAKDEEGLAENQDAVASQLPSRTPIELETVTVTQADQDG